MKCPECGTVMIRVDLPKLEGGHISIWLECPHCHFRTQKGQ